MRFDPETISHDHNRLSNYLQGVFSDRVLHGLRRGGRIYKIVKSAST